MLYIIVMIFFDITLIVMIKIKGDGISFNEYEQLVGEINLRDVVLKSNLRTIICNQSNTSLY